MAALRGLLDLFLALLHFFGRGLVAYAVVGRLIVPHCLLLAGPSLVQRYELVARPQNPV